MTVRDYPWREAEPADLVELRVHGVGGTPPETLLETHDVVQVRGDDVAGFYRRRDQGLTLNGRTLEAYSWGGLTSKSWTRALWVLLAPFALVNMAGWMLPAKPGAKEKRRWAHRAAIVSIRLICLHMTLMVTLWIGQITVDYVAYQCGALKDCTGPGGYLSFFDWPSFADPGRRIAVGVLVPAAFLLVGWLLSRMARGRYEADYPFSDPVDEGSSAPAGATDTFADPTLWKRAWSVKSFAELHLAAGLAYLGWFTAGAMASLDEDSELAQLAFDGGRFGSIVVLLAVVVAIAMRGMTPVESERTWLRLNLRRWVRTLLVLSVGLFIGSIVAASVWPAVNPASFGEVPPALRPIPRIDLVANYVVWGFALVLIVALIAHPERRTEIANPLPGAFHDATVRVGLRGWGAIWAVALGYIAALVFLSGVGSGTARLLGGHSLILYPYAYDAYAVGTVVFFVLGLMAISIAWWWRVRRYGLRALHEAHPNESVDQARPELRDTIAARRSWLYALRRRRVARIFVQDLERLAAPGLALALIYMAADFGFRFADIVGWADYDISDGLLGLTPAWLETVSSWLVAVGIPALMIYLVRRSFSSRTARKTVGILWDVTTFWPRWYHPLAPPSYAGRAVPEMRTRLDILTRDAAADRGMVVVSAHSQGSVLALAALDGLRRDQLFERISLVTHGSPIGPLYLRFFPAYLAGPIGNVATALSDDDAGRWVNLYRLTDPIGGAIGGECDPMTGEPLVGVPPDLTSIEAMRNPIPDPCLAGRVQCKHFPPPGDPYPVPRGHSDYYLSPEYELAVEFVTDSTRDRLLERMTAV